MPIIPVVHIVKFGNFLADDLTKEKITKKTPKQICSILIITNTYLYHITFYELFNHLSSFMEVHTCSLKQIPLR